jgi:HlyD family secretion protein
VDVLTTDAVDISPGAPVRIERWGGDSALTGHVRHVEPSAFTRLSALGVAEQRVNIIIDLDAPRERCARLGDGYRVEASIIVWVGHDLRPRGDVRCRQPAHP